MKELQGVSDTLYIPLEARIFASKNFPEFFCDEKALSLESYIPCDSIRKKSSEYAFMASAARYYNMDAIVKTFAATSPSCNVVYLGAGLETAPFQLGGISANFYSLDLPDVIDLRRSLLGLAKNETLIGCDMFSFEWTGQIDLSLPTIIVVCGVFQYFREDQVISFIRDLKNIFVAAEIVFDATNEAGIKFANRYVAKTGNASAKMYFFRQRQRYIRKENRYGSA